MVCLAVGFSFLGLKRDNNNNNNRKNDDEENYNLDLFLFI